MAPRGLKICLVVSTLVLIIVATVIVTLILTIFKPKDPDISVHPVGLENFEIFSPNSTANASLGMVITIVNPNYGRFKYINSTGYVKFHDTIVAEVPLETKSVPARGKIIVRTSASFMTGKLISDPKFWPDVEVGTLNLTSNAALPGKVSALKIFKLEATVYCSCDMSFNISALHVQSICISKIKL